MKLRWLASVVALGAFGAAPGIWAQTQSPGQDPNQTQTSTQSQPQSQAPTPDSDKDKPKASDIQNAPPQKPAALPTQVDSQIKHDGG